MEKSKQTNRVVGNDRLSSSLETELESLGELPSTYSYCIYRVPKQPGDKIFTLQVISIGPYHHGGQFKELLRRGIPSDSDEFVKLILLDLIFVIELLLRNQTRMVTNRTNKFRTGLDRIFHPPWLHKLLHNLLLLENQVPFFILEELLKLADIKQNHTALIDMSWNLFRGLHMVSKDMRCGPLYPYRCIDHFLELFINCNTPSYPSLDKGISLTNLPSIEELHEAGVKFKLKDESLPDSNQFNIYFVGRKLTIPKIIVDDHTELKFRNMMVYVRRLSSHQLWFKCFCKNLYYRMRGHYLSSYKISKRR